MPGAAAAAPLTAALAAGLKALAAPAGAATIETLANYLCILEHWNRRINLSGVRAPLEMVTRHVVDSVAVRPYLHGRRIADLGSGAGLPGIPLAVVYPGLALTLIESRARRAQFLAHAAAALSLPNVCVHHGRAEAYRPAAPFDTVLARAVGSVTTVLRCGAHLCAPAGRIVVMKGADPQAEIGALGAPGAGGEWRGWEAAVERYTVPGLAARRHAVLLARRPLP